MTTVSTTHGPVRGVAEGDLLRFAGIPYAAPPVGERRWKAPAPAEPWTEVRDGGQYGNTAPQNPDMLLAFLGLEPEVIDEDCLYLNVWTPAADDARRPVMVWIHGGAFIMGSGSSPMYHGGALVERGDIVLVTLNYRLGAFGFLELGWLDPDLAGSGNCGLLDQIAALEWVRDNVAAFGGDPDNVTVFGESAGGMSVASLLAAPAAQGLFGRAIAQSGAAQSGASPAEAEASARRYLDRLGVATAAELAALDMARLLEVQAELVVEGMTDIEPMLEGGVSASLPFRPVEDGRTLPDSVLGALRSGVAADVALMTGTTLEEWKLFALMDAQPIDDEVLHQRLDALTGDGDKALAVYGDDTADPKAVFTTFATDMVFRWPAVQLCEAKLAHSGDVWQYLFTWATPAMFGMLGSCHALELPFVFGQVGAHHMAMFLGEEAPVALSEAMMDAWLGFARHGDPGWARYDVETRTVHEFGEHIGPLEDPGAETRTFWASLDA